MFQHIRQFEFACLYYVQSSLFGIQYGCSEKKFLNFGFPSSFLTVVEQQQKVSAQ